MTQSVEVKLIDDLAAIKALLTHSPADWIKVGEAIGRLDRFAVDLGEYMTLTKKPNLMPAHGPHGEGCECVGTTAELAMAKTVHDEIYACLEFVKQLDTSRAMEIRFMDGGMVVMNGARHKQIVNRQI